jgi:hypothetical protein
MTKDRTAQAGAQGQKKSLGHRGCDLVAIGSPWWWLGLKNGSEEVVNCGVKLAVLLNGWLLLTNVVNDGASHWDGGGLVEEDVRCRRFRTAPSWALLRWLGSCLVMVKQARSASCSSFGVLVWWRRWWQRGYCCSRALLLAAPVVKDDIVDLRVCDLGMKLVSTTSMAIGLLR